MRSRSYRLPEGENVVLVDPPVEELPEVVARNVRLLCSADFTVAGVTFAEARAKAREDCLARGNEYCTLLGVGASRPFSDIIIACGHQPGFHHPGVWMKNHVVYRLAADLDGTGMNLAIDTDAPGSIDFRVPFVLDGKARIEHFRCLPIKSAIALEEQPVNGSACVAALADNVLPLLPDGLCRRHTGRYLHFLNQAALSGSAVTYVFTFARRHMEEEAGIHNLEVPYSGACGIDAFYLLMLEIIRRGGEFAAIYNNCLAEYRRKFKVRGKANPLPDLRIDGDTIELPLWIWRAGERRRQMVIRRTGGAVQVLLDGKVVGEFSPVQLADAADGIDTFRRLASAGIRVRSKALVTTMYIRLFLCDLFVHGIGGGNYDLITDDIIWAFFGIRPPAYAVATANVSLPVGRFPVSAEDVRRLKHEANRMRQAPANYAADLLPVDDGVPRLLAERDSFLRRQLAALPRDAKRAIFAETKRIDAALRAKLDHPISQKHAELLKAADALRFNEIIADREFPFCIYPEELLREVYSGMKARR